MIKKQLLVGEKVIQIELLHESSNEISFIYSNQQYSFTKIKDETSKIVIKNLEGMHFSFDFNEDSKGTFIVGKEGEVLLSTLESKRKFSGVKPGRLVSPMPGKIFKIMKNEGDKVLMGETILILEAMKMEHPIKSDKDGIIKKIHFKLNEQVQAEVILATIEGLDG